MGLVTILAPISLDHCSFLGDTNEAIAGEKAGILKRGRPAIVSRKAKGRLAPSKHAPARCHRLCMWADGLGRLRTTWQARLPGRGLPAGSAFAPAFRASSIRKCRNGHCGGQIDRRLSHFRGGNCKRHHGGCLARAAATSPGRLHDLAPEGWKSGSMADTIRLPERCWPGRWPILRSAFRAQFI